MHVEFIKNRIIARITIVTYSDLSWHKIQTTCSFLYSGKTIDKEIRQYFVGTKNRENLPMS